MKQPAPWCLSETPWELSSAITGGHRCTGCTPETCHEGKWRHLDLLCLRRAVFHVCLPAFLLLQQGSYSAGKYKWVEILDTGTSLGEVGVLWFSIYFPCGSPVILTSAHLPLISSCVEPVISLWWNFFRKSGIINPKQKSEGFFVPLRVKLVYSYDKFLPSECLQRTW